MKKLDAIRIIFASTFSFLIGCVDLDNAIETEPLSSVSGALIYNDVHDPSPLVRLGGFLYSFASATEWASIALTTNEYQFLGDDIYSDGQPLWYDGEALWAPHAYEYQPGRYRIYHSAVIDEDAGVSRIGFAEAFMDSDAFRFEAQNDFVIESLNTSEPFAIDPAVFKDKTGQDWLVYGSHGAGIWVVALDQETGLLALTPENKTWNPTDSRFTNIANYNGELDENNVEAAYVFNHPENEYYYLFVNWDTCCNGISSTYNIRVGRSTVPTGPFYDMEGNNMATGGGSLFIDASGEVLNNDRFVGPGHAGIYTHEDGTFYLTHHFYDANRSGSPALAIWNLEWENNWPRINTAVDVSF